MLFFVKKKSTNCYVLIVYKTLLKYIFKMFCLPACIKKNSSLNKVNCFINYKIIPFHGL